MNYADLARGIYSPVLSGEDVYSNKYPTPMSSNSAGIPVSNDTYNFLAQGMFTGMSGEDIQSALNAYLSNMYTTPSQQPTATPQGQGTPMQGYQGFVGGGGGGGGGGGIMGNPAFKQITSGAQNIAKQLFGGGIGQYGMTIGAPMGAEVTEAAGLVGGSGLGTGTNVVPSFDISPMFAGDIQGPYQAGLTGLGGLAGSLGPLIGVPALAGAGFPLFVLGGLIEGWTKMGQNDFNKPSTLQSNARTAQEQGELLNYFLGLQPGNSPEATPYARGAYDPNRSWMNELMRTEKGREAMNFQTFPNIPSTGLSLEDPRYRTLEEQLGTWNEGVEGQIGQYQKDYEAWLQTPEGQQYNPYLMPWTEAQLKEKFPSMPLNPERQQGWLGRLEVSPSTQYVNNPIAGYEGGPPSTMVAPSGFAYGVRQVNPLDYITPELAYQYGWGPGPMSFGG